MRWYDWVRKMLVPGLALWAAWGFFSVDPVVAQLSNFSGFGSGLTGQSTSRTSSGGGGISAASGLGSISGQSISGQFMDLGNVNTASQMLGTTSNQGFVGADSSDISTVMSMLQGASGRTSTRGGTGGLTSFGLNARGLSGLMGNRNRSTNRGITSRTRTGRNQQDPIRSALKVGFDVPQLEFGSGGEAGTASVSAAKSFASAAARMPGAAVEINVQGRMAVLQGTVPSDRDRLLAERLALLEPGIERVENRLTVVAPSP